MAGNLVPSNGSFGLSRDERSTNRALSRLRANTNVQIARLECAAEVEAVRVCAVGYVGKRALQEVTVLSQLEAQLATMCPMAVSRLQAIGDMTALAMADVVMDAVRRMR